MRPAARGAGLRRPAAAGDEGPPGRRHRPAAPEDEAREERALSEEEVLEKYKRGEVVKGYQVKPGGFCERRLARLHMFAQELRTFSSPSPWQAK